eukprot:4444422-Amphidinium_carterae.1
MLASSSALLGSKVMNYLSDIRYESTKDGNTVMQSDAEMAYVQATLKGCNTWVRPPKDRWPDSWKQCRDPVVPFVRALYGHPDSTGSNTARS